jgi:hypothetical protein
VSFDDLELELRRLPGVIAVGSTEHDDLLVVEVQVGPDACDEIAREATAVVRRHLAAEGRQVAVEVVRWGDGPPQAPETRLRIVEVTSDPSAGELAVHLARGEEVAVGRAPTAHGLLAVVEATVYAIRTFVPDLTYLPGWARTVETTPERRFLVVASVTDPEARAHLRGAAEGRTPLDAAARATLAALNRTISREL